MRRFFSALLLTGFVVALASGCSNKGAETPKTKLDAEPSNAGPAKGPTLPLPPEAGGKENKNP